MDYVITFSIIIIGICGASFLVLDKYYKIKARDYLNIPKQSPVSDDCIWQARKMVGFISDRLEETKPVFVLPENEAGMNSGRISLYESQDIVDLVRFAHLAGCRIVIEQIENHDIENPKNTKDVLNRYHTCLNRSRSERLEEKYSC